MEITHNIYEYQTHSKISLELDKISPEEITAIVSKLKSIGIDLHYRAFSDFPGMNEIIADSLKSGIIECSGNEGVSRCKKCGAGGFYPKYKSGVNKGQPNTNKDCIYPRGIRFNKGFISFANMGDYCGDCTTKYNIIDLAVQKILDLNLPIEIAIYGHCEKSKFIKDTERRCHSCGKTMFETEMNRSERMMDTSTYPSECPHCKAQSLIFGNIHTSTGKFRMLTIEEYNAKATLIKRCIFNSETKTYRYSDTTIKNGRVY